MRSAALSYIPLTFLLASCVSAPGGETPSADERVTPEQYRAVIGSRLSQFESCYELAIDAYPGAAGKMVVRFLALADGTVKDAEIKSSHPSLKAAEDCVLARLRALSFPACSGSDETEIIYPFFFTENGRLPAQ